MPSLTKIIKYKKCAKKIDEFLKRCYNTRDITTAYVNKYDILFDSYAKFFKKFEENEKDIRIFFNEGPNTIISCGNNLLIEDSAHLIIEYKSKDEFIERFKDIFYELYISNDKRMHILQDYKGRNSLHKGL